MTSSDTLTLDKIINDDTISSEDTLRIVKKMLLEKKIAQQRKQILSEHSSEIKQLPNNGRYYISIDKKRIFKTSREDIEELVIEHYMPDFADFCTLKNIYKEWSKVRNLEVSENTRLKDCYYWNHYIKDSVVATSPLSSLDVPIIKTWMQTIINEREMTRKYFMNVLCVLNSLFDYAVDKAYIPVNICRTVPLKKLRFYNKTKKASCDEVFSDEERAILTRHALSDCIDNETTIPLGILLLFETGLRDGELIALKYGDIKQGILHVQRMQVVNTVKASYDSYQRKGYKIVEHTKTSAGDRFIPLSSRAIEIINKTKEINTTNGFSVNNDDFIFLRDNGENINSRVIDTRLRKYCRQLGFSEIKSPHDIRRTFITTLIKKGMNPSSVQKLAGHEDIEMTMKYLRSNESNQELLEQLERMICI